MDCLQLFQHRLAKDSLKNPNTDSPMVNLSEDVLEEILAIAVLSEDQSMRRIKLLHSLASVCRQWYHLIHLASRFWSALDDSANAVLVRRLLKKSHTSPFTVRYEASLPKETAELLFAQLSRCRSFRAKVDPDTAQELFTAVAMQENASELQELIIGGIRSDRLGQAVDEITICSKRLQQLGIAGFHFPLDRITIHSQSLTHLNLQLTASRELHALQPYHNILSHLTHLQEVRLTARGDFNRYKGGFSTGNPLPRMVFPHLCTIELYYLPAPTTYFLLQSIESPRCRRVDVRIRSYVGSEVDPSMTLASFPLGTVVPELLASPTTLQLSHVENGGWTSIWSKQHGDQPHDDTSIFIDSLFNTGPSRLASSVMDLVDLSRVVELDLRGPTIVQLLHSLLPRLETLERLVVRDGGNMDNLISALGMPTPQLGWLCPQLRRIALHADSTYSQDCLLQFARARYRRDNVADTYCPTPLDALNVEFWDMGNRRSLLDQKSVEEITDILGQDCFANHNTNQD